MGILRQIEALFLALEPISCNLSIQMNTKNIKTFWSNLSIQIVPIFGAKLSLSVLIDFVPVKNKTRGPQLDC